MMLKNENCEWLSQKLISYTDQLYGSNSVLTIESTFIIHETNTYIKYENQTECLGLSFKLWDDTSTHFKSITLSYIECAQFVMQLTKLFKSFSDLNDGVIYSLVKKKQLVIELLQTQEVDRAKVIKLIILEDENNLSSIVIPVQTFFVVCTLVKNFVQNYFSIITTVPQLIQQSKIRKKIEGILLNVQNLSVIVNELRNIETATKSSKEDLSSDSVFDNNNLQDFLDKAEKENPEPDVPIDNVNNDIDKDNTKPLEKFTDLFESDAKNKMNSFNNFFESNNFEYVTKEVEAESESKKKLTTTLKPKEYDIVEKVFENNFTNILDIIQKSNINDELYENLDNNFKERLNTHSSFLPNPLTIAEEKSSLITLIKRNFEIVQNQIENNEKLDLNFEMILTTTIDEIEDTNSLKLQFGKYIFAMTMFYHSYIRNLSSKVRLAPEELLMYFKFRFICDQFWVAYYVNNTEKFFEHSLRLFSNLDRKEFFAQFQNNLEEHKIKKINQYTIEKNFKPYLNRLNEVFKNFEEKFGCIYSAKNVIENFLKSKSESKRNKKRKSSKNNDTAQNNLARVIAKYKNEFESDFLREKIFKIANTMNETKTCEILDKIDFMFLPFKIAKAFYLWDPENPKIKNRYDLYLKMIEEDSPLDQIGMLSIIREQKNKKDTVFF